MCILKFISSKEMSIFLSLQMFLVIFLSLWVTQLGSISACTPGFTPSLAQKTICEQVGARSPVLHRIEGLLVGDVVHEDEAHGAPVVGCRDGPIPLLPRRVLGKKRQGVREDTHGNSSEWV